MTRPKLLCVDDDAGIRELYRVLFGNSGYQVCVAEDGKRALELFRAHKFDGVVVDHEMPGLKGNELAAVLKHESPGTPVIMVSGCQSVLDHSPRFVDATLEKGSPIAVLLDKVGALLGSAACSSQQNRPLSRLLPLGSALASTVLLGFFVLRIWR